jgi:hypothetical protein
MCRQELHMACSLLWQRARGCRRCTSTGEETWPTDGVPR